MMAYPLNSISIFGIILRIYCLNPSIILSLLVFSLHLKNKLLSNLYDTKFFSKTIASRFIPIFPTIKGTVKGRFIGESVRQILNLCKQENIDGYLLTADLEKAFDSINHTFLICCLEKYGFDNYFISLIKLLLCGSESCVINGGTTTPYFLLQRGARQGDPIAAYLFILVLEIFFIMVRSNNSIGKIKTFICLLLMRMTLPFLSKISPQFMRLSACLTNFLLFLYSY